MEDEKRSIMTIFWLVLAFALSILATSAGAAWFFLEWIGVSEVGQVGLALLLLVAGIVGSVGSFAGIAVWFWRRAVT